MIFALFSLLAMVVYSFIIIACKRSWERLPEFVPHTVYTFPCISVIVAFRNEEDTLPSLLSSLSRQDYPSGFFEVILVNDHSEDNSCEIVQAYCMKHPHFHLHSLDENEKGKKSCIIKGIDKSVFGLIAVTDADCSMGKNWLYVLAAHFQQSGSQFVIGITDMSVGKGFFNRFQAIEFQSLVAVGAGAAAGGKAIYCNAANLFYSRRLFLSREDPMMQNVLSGDDTLFMLQVKNHMPGEIKVLKSAESIVTTKGSRTFGEFFSQRRRWFSKSRYYNDRNVSLMAWLVFMNSIFMIAAIVLFSAGRNFWLFPALFICKYVVDTLLVRSFLRFLGKSLCQAEFLLFSFMYPFYILWVVISGLLLGFNWKDRYFR